MDGKSPTVTFLLKLSLELSLGLVILFRFAQGEISSKAADSTGGYIPIYYKNVEAVARGLLVNYNNNIVY